MDRSEYVGLYIESGELLSGLGLGEKLSSKYIHQSKYFIDILFGGNICSFFTDLNPISIQFPGMESILSPEFESEPQSISVMNGYYNGKSGEFGSFCVWEISMIEGNL